MEISPALTARLAPLTASHLLQPLVLNQSLTVQVLQYDASKHVLFVLLGNQALQLQAKQPLSTDNFAEGSPLTLTVSQVSPTFELQATQQQTQTAISFKLLTPPVSPAKIASTATEPTDIQTVLNNQLRQLLPQQIPLTQLLQHLSQSLQDLHQYEQQVPVALKNLLALILTQLPNISALSNPETLQHFVQDSGLWLEAKLGQNKPLNLQKDLKANLLKLAQAFADNDNAANTLPETLDKQLKDLQQQVTGSLKALTLMQMQSLPQTASPQQWCFEIPYLQSDTPQHLFIQVEQDSPKKTHEPSETAWSVTLTLNPPGLSSISCKISYVQQTVNLYFKSESSTTATAISERSDALRTQLIAAGLNVGYLDSQASKVANPQTIKIPVEHLFQDNA